jgi:hypothetical protein
MTGPTFAPAAAAAGANVVWGSLLRLPAPPVR